MPRVYTTRPLAERFYEKVNTNGPIPVHRPELGPCHEWMGARSGNYGKAVVSGGVVDWAHRVAFFLAHGRWPTPCGLHACDFGLCVKALPDDRGPAHIFEGTKGDNIRDCVAKGRHVFQQHPERAARGDRNAARLYPELLHRGDDHWSHRMPERVLRGRAHPNVKVTEEKLADILQALANGEPQISIARRLDLHKMTINRIATGKTWRTP